MKIFVFFFCFMISACGSTELLTIDKEQVKGVPPAIITSKSIETLNARDFGARGDAVQVADFSVSGSTARSNTVVFTTADVGKLVSIAHAGKDGEHLLTTIKSIKNANTVSLAHKAENTVANVMGSYGTDNIVPLQNAINAAIQDGKLLFLEEGVFLIGDINNLSKQTSLRIKMTQSGQNFRLKGAGKDKTILREVDGKTQRLGRYTKIMYHYLNDTNNIGTIELSDFSFDKNGRSLTRPPSSLYEWEQAHCFSWASSKISQNTIETIVLKNLGIIDKIGAGINFSSGPTVVTKVSIENITERDFGGNNRSDIAYGQRGDLEISCFSNDISMSNVRLRYIQIEPVRKASATKENQRSTNIKNSVINTIEYTESDNGDSYYSSLFLDNVTSTNFVTMSLRFKAINSTLSLPRLVHSVAGEFNNCKIVIPYDASSNKINTINTSYLRTLGKIKNNILFENCTFVIENGDVSLKPLGFAITSSAKVKDIESNVVTIKGCTFDPRLEGSVNAYANGSWNLVNNDLAGYNAILSAGGYKDFMSTVKMVNNRFPNSNTGHIKINNHNSFWSIDLSQENSKLVSKLKFKRPGKYESYQIKY